MGASHIYFQLELECRVVACINAILAVKIHAYSYWLLTIQYEFSVTPNQSMILATNDFSLAFISNENLPTHIKYHGFADNRTFCELVLP